MDSRHAWELSCLDILTALLPAAKTLDVDFDDSDLGIGKMLRNLIGRDQHFRVSVICHVAF